MPRRLIRIAAAVLAAALAPVFLSALNTLDLPKTVKPPTIDGKLEPGEWDGGYSMTEFRTFKPDYDKVPSQKTEAYFLYDADYLYFAFRCHDTEAAKIKASLAKRDDMFNDDYVGIVIDTYNTMQNAYTFALNPLGIQGDGMMTPDGNLTGEQDFLWDGKGALDSEGYSIEYRIPLQSIRFPAGETVTFRLFFFRQLIRTSEMVSAPGVLPDKGSILAQSQPIAVSGLKFKRVVEILPAVTHSDRQAVNQGVMAREERATDLSLTAKVGLTTDLTLDAAVNPDFSQVEADAGQVDVNLRYDLYYSEKRPFFLEGNEIFALSGNSEDAPLYGLVYTRTIVDPTFGFKLSGKLGASNSIAAIFARDNQPEAADEHPYFSVFRFKHALKEDSFIGGFYTARDYEGGANRVFGLDGRFRTSPIGYMDFHLLGSTTKSPDAGSTAGGHALGLHYNQGTRNYYLDFGYQDISPNFQTDTGFIERTGLRRLGACGILMFYPEKSFIQRYDTFYWSYHLHDTASNMWETFNMFCLRFFLPGSSEVRIEGILANEVYEARRFARSGFGLQTSSQITKQVYFRTFFRRTGAIYYDPGDPHQGDGNRVEGTLSYQPTDQFNFTLALTYRDFTRRSDKVKVYDYTILRSHNTFQLNKYLFLRVIGEYNTYYKRWTADFLASFTYIPGTVVYVGYGSAFEKIRWADGEYVDSDRYLETKRGFFFKVSYLWRW